MRDPMNRYDGSATDDAYQGYGAAGMSLPITAVDRGPFIVQTYMHLFGAILAFVGIEVALFTSGLADRITGALIGSGVPWLVILGAFILVSWLATRVAATSQSLPAQYMALMGYVVAEAIIFVPLLYIADKFAPGAIRSAAICTLLGFTGLTMVAFGTRKDFSFLRGILIWSGICALLLIVASVIFGWQLGTWFSVAMVALAGASILYDTSNILRVYPQDRYVSASLQLFASVAMMFYYILRIFLDRR